MIPTRGIRNPHQGGMESALQPDSYQRMGVTMSAGLAEAMRAFERHLSDEKRVSPHTLRNYLSDLRQFAEFLGRLFPRGSDPCDVDVLALRAYLGHLHQKGLSKASVGRKLAALRSFFRFLHREGKVASNPARILFTPRQIRKVPRVLTEEEAVRLLEAPGEAGPRSGSIGGVRERAILELFYATGLRASELAGLDLDRLYLRDRILRIVGKGRKERIVPFGEPAASALQAYLTAREEKISRSRLRRSFFEPEGRPAHHPLPPAHRGTCRAQGTLGAGDITPHSEALFRNPPSGPRGGPQGHPGTPRARQPQHHPEIHPRGPRLKSSPCTTRPTLGLKRREGEKEG